MKKNVLIVGLGLLGTSLAMALKELGKYHIAGYTRRRSVIHWAVDENILEEDSLNPLEEQLANADIIIIALPIPNTLEFVKANYKSFKKGVIVTDVGSTKKAFMDCCKEVLEAENISYVGSHPMAGTEKSGPYNAFKELYKNADTFICSDNLERDKLAVEEISNIWKSISCNTVIISTEEHDNLVAKTSHVAHVLASALTISVLDYGNKLDNFHGCASGFRDTSRTASSDPVMWREIMEQNREAILNALDKFDFEYAKFRKAIENSDFDAFEKEFYKGRKLRAEWLDYMNNKENK